LVQSIVEDDREVSTVQHLDQVFESFDSFTYKVALLYITIDLDGFADCFAPGVSAPSPLGFDVDFSLACVKYLLSSDKVISVDLAELNPAFDIDSRTSKLAASLAYHIIDSWK
jgi:formiminoglutamase